VAKVAAEIETEADDGDESGSSTEYATKDDVREIVADLLEPFKSLLLGEADDEEGDGADLDGGTDAGGVRLTPQAIEELIESKVKAAVAPLRAKAAKKAPPPRKAPPVEDQPVPPRKRTLSEMLWG